jgi:hypothetical protein
MFAVTDRNGRFELKDLPPGAYVLRAYLKGYAGGRARTLHVPSGERVSSDITLARVSGPRLLAAGISLGSEAREDPLGRASETTGTADEPDAEDDGDRGQESRGHDGGDHTERIWRLRHARRGVIKDATLAGNLPVDDGSERPAGPGGLAPAAPRVAARLFADTLSGQVNLLTTGLFNTPQQLFDSDRLSHGIAHVRVGAPLGDGDWSVRGAFSETDISSWFVGGSYTSRESARHHYRVGLAYSTQRYGGGNPLALRDVTDGSRNAGGVAGFHTFTVSPALKIAYGARFARYDYLEQRGLVSPRADVTVTAARGLRFTLSAAHSARAPGAEEFLPPGDDGLWLPPQRTFSSLEAGRPFRHQRATHLAAGFERDFGTATVSAGVYRQRIEDQLVSVFGAELPDQPAANIGHYLVTNAGDAEALGYRVGFRTVLAQRVNGAVEYLTTSAELAPADDLHYLLLIAPSAVRPSRERLHDVATTLEANVPETSTRVFVLYRISNGFAQPHPAGALEAAGPRVDTRFDVQVRQGLPFLNFSSARVEMLLMIRNFFRDPGAEQTIYDELLVVRPPKRIVGGVTMHF